MKGRIRGLRHIAIGFSLLAGVYASAAGVYVHQAATEERVTVPRTQTFRLYPAPAATRRAEVPYWEPIPGLTPPTLPATN